MSHYDKLREAFIYGNDYISGDTTDDAAGFTNQEPVRKHTAGKAQGARFCYIKALYKYTTNKDEIQLILCLDLLVKGKDVYNKSILTHCANSFGDHKEFWNGVVAVRRKALESGKYTADGYEKPIDVNLLLDAIARHLISYIFIDKIDEESGENHLCHIAANLIMHEYQKGL